MPGKCSAGFYNGKQSHVILFIMTGREKKSISKSFLHCEIQFLEIYAQERCGGSNSLALTVTLCIFLENTSSIENAIARYIYFAFASSACELFAAPSVAASQSSARKV